MFDVNMGDDNGELMPHVGMIFNTLEDAWKYWCNYGKQMGFSVRKDFKNTSKKDGEITSRGFVCSKEGVRKEDKRRTSGYHRDETRTDCKARFFLSLERHIGKYKVYDFVPEHNHMLHLSETTYMMRSQRKITGAQAAAIDLVCGSGIKPKDAIELMSREAGGRSNLGYTANDQKNYLRTRRSKFMEHGEASSLLRYFQDQVTKNPAFHYVVQLDSEMQITNIFWVDAKMLVDYTYFGDVITFDTTYGTNKELRPLAVFTGFNHHRTLVTFGAALLYDETIETFKWLFTSFLEAHKGKKPKTIFTDQDVAMARALSEVMHNTFHGLCNWHIMQNAIKHLGNLKKDDSCILEDLKKCMFHYDTEVEFQKGWDEMIERYSVQNHKWLHGIYDLKKKWARCHLKNELTLGVRSTQLSESLNGDLKDHLVSTLRIADFFDNFERVIEHKRQKELEAEFDCREKIPTRRFRNSPFLKQAVEVYTPKIYGLFQDEVDRATGTRVKASKQDQSMHEYYVENLKDNREYIVWHTPSDGIISCSCRMFEHVGFLCCHVIRGLDRLGIMSIPEAYILKRWTRNAKSGYTLNGEETIEDNGHLESARIYRRICPRMVRLASRCSENQEASALVDRTLKELEKKVDEILEGQVKQVQVQVPQTNGLMEEATGFRKREGRKASKRPKSFIEKQPRRNIAKQAQAQSETSSLGGLSYNGYYSQQLSMQGIGFQPYHQDIAHFGTLPIIGNFNPTNLGQVQMRPEYMTSFGVMSRPSLNI